MYVSMYKCEHVRMFYILSRLYCVGVCSFGLGLQESFCRAKQGGSVPGFRTLG